MKYSAQEVLQYVMEEDVKFIRLVFCDILGNQKNVSIMPSELMRAFEYGISFDGSAVCGLCPDDIHSDLFLHPEPDTLLVMPWRPEHGRVVRMFCSITYPDRTVIENDTRNILKRAIEDAKKAGYLFSFGTEIEFYLCELAENGKPTKTPNDNAGYMDVAPPDKGENVRRDICLTLEEMGILPEASHHEEGPGQHEIDFRYADALTAADNSGTFRTVVSTVADRHGLCACFTPKPLPNAPGNGLHINMSLESVNKNENNLLNRSIAGILDRIAEMTIFLNPTNESFERLGGHKAPIYVSWGKENRSQLIRVPAVRDGLERAELRSPDPMTNPYIAFALIIYASLEGLLQKKPLQDESNFNIYTADDSLLKGLKKMPVTIDEAARAAYESDFIKEHLPKQIIEKYCLKNQ